jgi:hypothetical protein
MIGGTFYFVGKIENKWHELATAEKDQLFRKMTKFPGN